MALILSTPELRKVLEAFKKDLEKSTGKHPELYLYGSYAKGYQDIFSDVDLLVLTPEGWNKEDDERLQELRSTYSCLIAVSVFS